LEEGTGPVVWKKKMFISFNNDLFVVDSFVGKGKEEIQYLANKTGLKKWQVVFAIIGKPTHFVFSIIGKPMHFVCQS
jgi:hypothetical protein